MLALVIESRPQSVRYHLFEKGAEGMVVLIKGVVHEIGSENPQHEYDYGVVGGRGEGATIASNHWEAMARIASVLSSRTTGEQDYSQHLVVVAHRVPHGGQRFKAPVMISDEVIQSIDAFSPYAPLGNPAALEGIRAALNTFPAAPHVAVFDTAFHQSMPSEAFTYSLPYELYERRGLRRFGFHSISHRHAIATAASELGTFPEALRVISVHLGEENSASAFAKGRCIDTTSGLTAQSGLLGGTASGSIDPAAITFLLRSEGLSVDRLERLLSREAGLLGLSGLSPNLIDLIDEADKGDKRCRQAIAVFLHQMIRALGGLIAVMGGVDLLIFTGENGAASPRLRAGLCERLGYFGVVLDGPRNEHLQGAKAGDISHEKSAVKVFVVPSDEERTIAQESLALVSDDASP